MPKLKSKKLDPKKLFVVSTVSRETIAESLNDALDHIGSDVARYSPDDLRLTDQTCQDIADALYSVSADSTDEEYGYFVELVSDLPDDMK